MLHPMLAQEDVSGEVPSMRCETYSRRDPSDLKEPEKFISKGCVVSHSEDFDKGFAGVSSKEIEHMDTQQRHPEVPRNAFSRSEAEPSSKEWAANTLLIYSCVVFAAASFLYGYDNAVVGPVAALGPFVRSIQ
jgi:hypothetical protein